MGRTEWENLPAASAVHPAFRLDEQTGRNLVQGNRDEAEHVECVFEQVLKSAGGGRARIDVIAAEWTGAAVVRFLARNCELGLFVRAALVDSSFLSFFRSFHPLDQPSPVHPRSGLLS